jgi:hypothetical protein
MPGATSAGVAEEGATAAAAADVAAELVAGDAEWFMDG